MNKKLLLLCGLASAAFVGDAHASSLNLANDVAVAYDGSNFVIDSVPYAVPLTINNVSSGAITISTDGNYAITNSSIRFVSTGNNMNFVNDNAITIAATNYAQLIGNAGTANTFTNNGSISMIGGHTANVNSGFILNGGGEFSLITNNGTLSGSGIHNAVGTIDDIVNADSASITSQRFAIKNSDMMGTIRNSGTLSTTLNNANTIYNAIGTLDTITNSGTISATASSSHAIRNNDTINTIDNSGTISAIASGSFAIDNESNIGTLTNESSGIITSGAQDHAIINNGAITTLNNYGTLTSAAINIQSQNGTVGTLLNAQGGGSPLTYMGNMPSTYITYFSTSSSYGKVAFSAPSGWNLANYGIAWGTGVILTPTTIYTAVLSADSALTVPTGVLTSGGATFELLPESGADLVYDLRIDSFTPVVSGAVSAQGNSPAAGAAAVIDANSNLGNLFSTLSGNQAISNAATQTLPLLTGSQSFVIENTLQDVDRIIQARQEGEQGLSAGDTTRDRHFWFKPFGSWANQDNNNGVSGYNANTYGSLFGADGIASEHNRLGAAFAYAHSTIDGNSTVAPQSSDIDSYQAIVYGSHSLDNITDVNYQLDLGMHSNNGSRNILFTGQIADSSYDSWSGHMGVGLARVLKVNDKTSITPSVRADYTVLRSDSYSETGAGILDLHVNSQTAQELIPAIDVKVARALTSAIQLTANLGGGYDIINDRASITAAFAGAPSAAFVTKGIQPSPWIGRGGLGLTGMLNSKTEIGAHYDFEVRDGFNNQTASVKARWAF